MIQIQFNLKKKIYFKIEITNIIFNFINPYLISEKNTIGNFFYLH